MKDANDLGMGAPVFAPAAKRPLRKLVLAGMPALFAFAAGLVFLAASTDPAAADFRLCNNTASRVGVAVGYKDAEGWTTEGWWNLPSHTCETILKAISWPVIIMSTPSTTIAAANGWDRPICVPGTRNSRSAASATAWRAAIDRTGFFEVDTGEQRAWTVQLTESSEQPKQRPLPADNPLSNRRRPRRARAARMAAAGRRRAAPARSRRRERSTMRRQRRTKVVATLGPASSDRVHDRPAVRCRRRRISHQYEPHQSPTSMREFVAHDPRHRKRARTGRSASWSTCKARNCGSAPSRNDRREIDGGQDFVLDADPAPGDATRVHLPHPEIFAAIKPGDSLLIDDGKLRLKATDVDAASVSSRVSKSAAKSRAARA